MQIARVTGTVTSTNKDLGLSGAKLVLIDIVDKDGGVLEPAHVAFDACGAGAGSLCLLVRGSSARIPSSASGKAVDAVLVGIIDEIATEQVSTNHIERS